ncbi:hypothetical protein PGT21_010026 [Puccinia graminis f. sp. tritici]|uniref:Uncharacterized protein n=1 Tax=Puccinia graminis f. sp. tritici TaxID=56615 RepID=A0A5B0LYU6_PUCGR|nr:hypothetical protein PGT21_010026 [Puccinia graminis f. sp. tritici]
MTPPQPTAVPEASVGVIAMAHGSRPGGHVDTKLTPPIATGTCISWVDMITPPWQHDDPQCCPDLPWVAVTTLSPAGALVHHVVALPAGELARRSGLLQSVPLCTNHLSRMFSSLLNCLTSPITVASLKQIPPSELIDNLAVTEAPNNQNEDLSLKQNKELKQKKPAQ